MAQARGGQIVVSQSFATAIGDELSGSNEFRPLGEARLRGFETSERLYEATTVR